MCNNTATSNYLQVEVVIGGAQQQYSLKDQPVLRTCKRIVAIEVSKVDNVSTSPSGTPVVNNVVFAKSFLVMQTPKGDKILDSIPFADLDRVTNNGRLFYVNIPPIDPSKSYIQVGSLAGIVPGQSFLLGFHYETD